MTTTETTPEERVREAALEAGMDPEQALNGLARRKARAKLLTARSPRTSRHAPEVVPDGLQWCAMGSHLRPVEQFEGRRTCGACRALAREAMRRAREASSS